MKYCKVYDIYMHSAWMLFPWCAVWAGSHHWARVADGRREEAVLCRRRQASAGADHISTTGSEGQSCAHVVVSNLRSHRITETRSTL